MLTLSLIGMTALTAPAPKLIVGYMQNWNDLAAQAAMVDFDKLTHLNIAFENPVDDQGTMSYLPENDLLVAKAHAKKVKVLISIGGGGAADSPVLKPRYFDLITDAKRPAFVALLTKYVIDHNLDGIDVDLEGPSINENYGAFVQDLAKALRAKGKLITSALSQGYGGDKVPASAFDAFDFVNIMAYDGTGPWAPNTPGQHSSYDYAKSNVAFWTNRGLPKAKAVLGVPFYGYGFGESKGDYTYRQILATYPGAEKLDQVGNTIWYNGIPTIRAKAKYVVDEGLAGVMIWSIDQDVQGNNSLLTALHSELKQKR
jgi:chitinase